MSDQKRENTEIYTKITFLVTAIMMIIIGYVLSFIPNKLDVAYIEDNYIYPVSDFVAEKSELIQYAILTVSFPILFIIFYKIISRVKPNINNKIEKMIDGFSILMLIALVLKIFSMNADYINESIISSNSIIFFMLLPVIIIGIFLYKNCDTNRKNIISTVSYIVITILIGFVSYLYINYSYSQTDYILHHADAYMYPIYKINSGLTPGVDFNSIYGYYPYLFSMIMQLFGKTGIFSFSIIVASLVFIALSCLSIFSIKMIKNKLVLILTVFSFIYTLIVYHILVAGSYYLQYVPHRILFPAILLVYILIYLKLRNKKCKSLLKLAGFIISTLAILWNLETGIIVLGVWICFLGYEILFFNSIKEKKTYIEVGKVILMTAFSIIFYFAILNLTAFIRTGNFVGIMNIIYGQANFLGSGFYMIKMKLWHPWVLLVLIYGVALAISIRKLKFMKNDNESENFEKNSAIFALAILGMGIFSYYQGRSHNYVFMFVIYPAVILLGIYLDYLIANYSRYMKTEKIYSRSIIIILLIETLTLFSLSTAYYLCTNETIKNMSNKQYLKENNKMVELVNRTREVEQIIGKMDFILPHESYYYIELGIEDKKNFPSYVDLFEYEDCKKIITYMRENEVTICTDEKIYNILNNKYGEELEKIIDTEYKVVNVRNYILFVNKDNWNKIVQLEALNQK